MIRDVVILAGTSTILIVGIIVVLYYLGLVHVPVFIPAGL